MNNEQSPIVTVTKEMIMGIVKRNTAQQAASAPAFEQMHEDGDTAVLEAEQTSAATPAAPVNEKAETVVTKQAEAPQVDKTETVEKQAAEAPAQQAAASRPSNALSLIKRDENGRPLTLLSGKGESTNLLANLRGAFAQAGHTVEYSTFPRLRLDTGKIATPTGSEAGDWIELQVISYDPSWVVGTGTEDEASKVHVRFSDNGETIQGAGDDDEYAGMSLKEYVQVLKDKGFEKASIKEYTLVTGIALAQQADDFEHANEIVCLAMSPTSKTKFDSYVISRGLQARMGKVVEKSANPVVRFTSERVKGKERSYFTLKPSHGTAQPVDL